MSVLYNFCHYKNVIALNKWFKNKHDLFLIYIQLKEKDKSTIKYIHIKKQLVK
jgi:hypothetical protein